VLLAAWSGPLSTLFAAIAALCALGAIWQARRLHAEDRADRARERDERRREFETERDESRHVLAEQRRLQQLEQLERVSELVASVRKTARDEASGTDGRIAADRTSAPFFWNARKQLELGINIFEALGGPALPACRDLATSRRWASSARWSAARPVRSTSSLQPSPGSSRSRVSSGQALT
jgi:hypothetical protein